MQCTPVEIKEKLLKALDEDNNVVDMAGVLAVITVLETYPITKEALEQTRIGRHVNELRRKTSNEQLAKRAKKLVRNWQKLISATPQSDNCSVNGDKDNGERLKHSQVTSVQGSITSSCPNSPAFSQKVVSPAVNRVNAQNASVRSSPSNMGGGKPSTPNLQQLPQRIKSKPGTPKLPYSPANSHSKPNTPNLQFQQEGVRGKSNSYGLSQNSKTGLSPCLRRTDSPKYCHSVKTVNSPKVSIISPKAHIHVSNSPKVSVFENSSRVASPEGSVESSLGRPNTPSECGSTSRPQTPLSPNYGPEQLGGRLPRNSSHESLSNSSINNAEERHQYRSNHSSELPSGSKTISPKALEAAKPDQTLNVKTNVANKKRSREHEDVNGSGKPNKVARMHNSDNSSYKKIMNGSIQSSSSADGSVSESGHSSHATTPDLKSSFSSKKNVSLVVRTDTTPKVSEKLVLSAKTPKVKTTAQLIADLQAKSGSSALGSSVIREIETNQIHKEEDVPDSVLPPGVGRRKRQKHLPPDTSTPIRQHATLSQTKTELVEKFLQTSVTPSTAEDLSPFKYDVNKAESPITPTKDDSSIEVDVTNVTSSSGGDTSFRPTEAKTDEHVDTQSSNNVLKEEQTRPLTLEEAYNLLPPIDYDNILTDDAEEESSSIPVQEPVNESVLQRVHEENWEGVNGCYNAYGRWCDWTQTLSRSSYNDDVLHILPYVLIDD